MQYFIKYLLLKFSKILRSPASSVHSIVTYQKEQMFEHRIDRTRTVATFSNVYGKSCVGFCLETGKHAQKFHFRSNRKRKVSLENSARDFQYIPLFQRSACFYVKITGHFDCFQYFNFETNFLKKENLFKKLNYRFLVESIKVENATFPYKSALSEVKVKGYLLHKIVLCH